MNREELMKKIISFLNEYAEDTLEDCNENSQLIADLGFNSLDLISIVNDLEEEFNIVIDDADMDAIVTVKDVVDLIEKKKEG